MKMGNVFAQDIMLAPFSYDYIWQRNIGQVRSIINVCKCAVGPISEIEEDKIYMNSAIRDILSQPLLILRKVIVSGTMFWYIGETPTKTMVLAMLRLPVLLLAFFSIYYTVRYMERRLWLVIISAITYWIWHLPFAPPSRLSVPITPTIFMFAMSFLHWIGYKKR